MQLPSTMGLMAAFSQMSAINTMKRDHDRACAADIYAGAQYMLDDAAETLEEANARLDRVEAIILALEDR